MTEASQPFSSSWWRFSEYQLWGSYIRPAPEAELIEYDPWELFEKPSKRDSGPYQELMTLSKQIRGFSANHMPEDSAPALLDWCNRYGLLGVLPHQLESTTFAARWTSLGSEGSAIDYVHPDVTTYDRVGYAWFERHVGDGNTIRSRVAHDAGTLVDESLLSQKLQYPRALIRPLNQAGIVEQTVGGTWGPFFPDVPRKDQDTHLFPMPLSEDFFRSYREPVREFKRAASLLTDVVEALTKEDEPESEVFERLSMWRAFSIEELSNRLLDRVTPLPQADGAGRLRLGWHCSSLLSALGMAAVVDITGGRKPTQCDVCGAFFTAVTQKAVYCSLKCQRTAQKRSQRRRKKDARAKAEV